MRAFFAFLFAFALGCAEEPSSTYTTPSGATAATPVAATPFDPQKATAKGKEYLSTLYGTKKPNGPVCLGEKVSGEYTQCSYTYTEADGSLKAGTILCSTTGCMEGSAPTAVPVANMPVAQAGNSSDSITDEWLFWYLLFSNGGTSSTYHHWYDSTPPYGRTGYYSPTYVPSVQSRSYYNTTYSKPVSTVSTSKYSSKTSYSTYKPSTTSTSTYRPTTTTTSSSKSTATSTSSSSKSTATSTSSSSRSSGFGSSSRSSGYRSSGSSSRGGRR